MMRMVALALVLSLVAAGGAFAINPSLTAGGGGTNVQASGRDLLWSEPPNLDGLIASSEVIGSLGLVTEIANDFFLTSDGHTVFLARWWGGYWNNYGCGDIGYATNWNVCFYDDGGCMPLNVLSEYPGSYSDETFVYCQSGVYPIFQYEACVAQPIVGNTLYWFSAQAADHTFPPQVGRVASAGIVACDTVFRSAYFAFPEWTPAIDVFGVTFDASQEFDMICGSVPVQQTTWGAVKALYR